MALNGEIRATLVQALRRNERARGLESALAVGGVILDGWFDGDLDSWRSGQAGISLRALARDPAISLSSSTLTRYVGITALCRKMGRTRFNHLGTSHLRQVLRLPMEDQIALVTLAETEGWTVQRLMDEARERRARGVPPRRHRKSAAYADALVHIQAWLHHPGRLEELERIQELLPEMASRLLQFLESARMDLERLESRVREVVSARDRT